MEPWLFVKDKESHITFVVSTMKHLTKNKPSTLWGRHGKRENPESQQQALHATHLTTEAEQMSCCQRILS